MTWGEIKKFLDSKISDDTEIEYIDTNFDFADLRIKRGEYPFEIMGSEKRVFIED